VAAPTAAHSPPNPFAGLAWNNPPLPVDIHIKIELIAVDQPSVPVNIDEVAALLARANIGVDTSVRPMPDEVDGIIVGYFFTGRAPADAQSRADAAFGAGKVSVWRKPQPVPAGP
jgi:hypothetical protein